MHFVFNDVKVVDRYENKRQLFLIQRIVHLDMADFFCTEEIFPVLDFRLDPDHKFLDFSRLVHQEIIRGVRKPCKRKQRSVAKVENVVMQFFRRILFGKAHHERRGCQGFSVA